MNKTMAMLIAGILLLLVSCNNSESKTSAKTDTLKMLEGKWLSTQDSLSTLAIKYSIAVFNYNNEKTKAEDLYQLALTNKLVEFVNDDVSAEFLILTNQNDTLNYEILGITEDLLSLRHYPTAQKHMYRKKQY